MTFDSEMDEEQPVDAFSGDAEKAEMNGLVNRTVNTYSWYVKPVSSMLSLH